jgi:chromosome segregation ATPase
MKSQKELNALQILRKRDLDEQKEMHEAALSDLRRNKDKEIEDVKARADEKEQEHKKNMDELGKQKDTKIEILQQRNKGDLEQQKSMTLKAEEKCQHLEKQLSGGDAGMKDMQTRLEKMESELSAANKARDTAEKHLSEFKEAAKNEAAKAKAEVEKQLSESMEARETTQSELDDLLMVFGDLEEKMTKYKDRLIELGETVSDGEDDDEDEDASDADGSEESDNNDDEKDETKEQPKSKSKR